MTHHFSMRASAAATAFLAIFCWFGLANASSEYSGTGVVLLTVTGEMQNPSRGGFDDENDKIFSYNGIAFEAGVQFDFEGLTKLGMVAVITDFPKGGEIHLFEGPRLQDVLEAAGVKGKMLTLRALDGYAVEAPVDELIAKGAVVALKRDGKPFGIGDFGPTQIVFPRSERADLAEMSDDNWVWSIYNINVE